MIVHELSRIWAKWNETGIFERCNAMRLLLTAFDLRLRKDLEQGTLEKASALEVEKPREEELDDYELEQYDTEEDEKEQDAIRGEQIRRQEEIIDCRERHLAFYRIGVYGGHENSECHWDQSVTTSASLAAHLQCSTAASFSCSSTRFLLTFNGGASALIVAFLARFRSASAMFFF